MNSTNMSTPVMEPDAVSYSGTHRQRNVSSHVYDTAGWTFDVEPSRGPNLTFLPILALILLVVGSMLKLYKWSRDNSRMKARGDVEFGDEDEVNYGIIHVGDKGFCPIDIRADGASVYDTVNSLRVLGNGYASQLSGAHPYYDTVTSYKSLLMQKADGSHYDSVKSYKAFLQRVTQNKDLAVEVKLLENYPIRSKSAEHCVVLEEESSERSGEVATKMLGTLPLKKQLHEDGRFPQFDRKRPRHRRASGDVPVAMRKRSASNPTSRRVTKPTASLPSIRYPLSSDSDEDTQQSFMTDRKKLWAERKKMSRSTSGNKISKDPCSGGTSSKPEGGGCQGIQKRRRHYSADSARRFKKAALVQNKDSDRGINNKVLKDKSGTKVNSKNAARPKKHVKKQTCIDESSSENPNSSHSSCESDVPSDAIISESDDDTKQNTLLSNASDDRTMDNDVFFSFDSGAELASSSEILHSSPNRPLFETKKRIARAKEDFFMNKDKHSSPLPPPSVLLSTVTPKGASLDTENSNTSLQSTDILNENVLSSSHINHSELKIDNNTNCNLQHPSGSCLGPQVDSASASNRSSFSTGSQQASENFPDKTGNSETISSPTGESQNMSSPRKVQRFQVTFVNADISSLNSE